MEKCKFSPNEDCKPLACLLRATSAVPAAFEEKKNAEEDVTMFEKDREPLEGDDGAELGAELYERVKDAQTLIRIAVVARNCAFEKILAIKEAQKNSA